MEAFETPSHWQPYSQCTTGLAIAMAQQLVVAAERMHSGLVGELLLEPAEG